MVYACAWSSQCEKKSSAVPLKPCTKCWSTNVWLFSNRGHSSCGKRSGCWWPSPIPYTLHCFWDVDACSSLCLSIKGLVGDAISDLPLWCSFIDPLSESESIKSGEVLVVCTQLLISFVSPSAHPTPPCRVSSERRSSSAVKRATYSKSHHHIRVNQ